MIVQDRLKAACVAALLYFVPTAAMTQENPGWHGEKWDGGASLFYGIPQTDYAPISFSCAQGDDLTFVFAFEPINAVDGVEVEVLLQAGDIEVPIATTGARLEMDDSFILEGRTKLDARLTDLITSRGTLLVFVEDGAEEYPLDGAREAAAALIETCSAGVAASAPPSEAARCDLAAWVMEDAPADLAVRAGPGPDYPSLATVPGPYSDGEETYFPEVKITGSRDGWFQVAEIVTGLYGGQTAAPVTAFTGEGWLPGDVLRLWVESGQLWSGPSAGAPIAVSFDDAGSGAGYFEVDALRACEGVWVEVEGTYSGERLRGWTSDTCANQVTTCP